MLDNEWLLQTQKKIKKDEIEVTVFSIRSSPETKVGQFQVKYCTHT